MIETIQCDICGRDYEADSTLFSPLGTEYVIVRLADFEEESVRHIKHNTCPECTRKILRFVDDERNAKKTCSFMKGE